MSDSLLMLLEMIEEVLEEQKRANKGNVLEGILVAAFGALFDKTFSSEVTSSKLQPKQNIITAEDILDVISNLRASSKQLQMVTYSKSYKKDERTEKQIKLQIGLKPNEIKELIQIPNDASLRSEYSSQIGSCVSYVNQNRFRKLARRLLVDPEVNIVSVLTIGKTQKKGETADVVIEKNGERIESLDVSVKKDNTAQISQATAGFTGTGAEASNFLRGIEDKYGFLFNVVPANYQKFQAQIRTLFQQLSGPNCVIGTSRTDVYLQADLALQKCPMQNVNNLDQFLASMANELKDLLNAVAAHFTKNPDDFKRLMLEFVPKNIGASEIFKSDKKGQKPKVGRLDTLEKNLDTNPITQFGAELTDPASPTVFFTADGEKLLKFRFRRDVSTGKKKNLVARVYFESTDAIYDLMKFGTKVSEHLTIEIVDDT